MLITFVSSATRWVDETTTTTTTTWSNRAKDHTFFFFFFFFNPKAYYGGEARCDVDMNGDFDPSELVCGGCSDVARAQMCPKHGTDFLEYKCRYCCSVAVFFCFGTTHFCNSCHDDFQRVTNIPKSDLPACPAGTTTWHYYTFFFFFPFQKKKKYGGDAKTR